MKFRDFWRTLSGKEKYVLYASTAVLLLSLVLYKNIFSPPARFSDHTLVTISEGRTLTEVSYILEQENIVQSSGTLRNLIILLHNESAVIAGDYFFDEPESIFKVAKRITSGDYGLDPERITIPEGLTVFGVAKIFADRFPKFDPERFIEIAEEGFIFPDTYFFLPNVRAEEVVSKMRQTFDVRIATIQNEIQSFGRDLATIVNMASIVEAEARNFEDRRMIAGILWQRFDDEHPLQVDVAFQYINGKNTYNLTKTDLATTSPYNTYVHVGLPPTPINSPGLEALLATVTPIESDYYFFLSDRAGNFYYSKTYPEHQAKQRLYVH